MKQKSLFILVLSFISITIAFQNCGQAPSACVNPEGTTVETSDCASGAISTASTAANDPTWGDYSGVTTSGIPSASGTGSTSGGSSIPGGTTTITASSASPSVTNSSGVMIATGSYNVVPAERDFSFSKDLISISVDSGAAFVFAIDTANATGTITYKWFKKQSGSTQGFVQIAGVNSPNFSRHPAQVSDDGYYYVVANDGKTEIKSREVRLTVNEIIADCSAGQYAHQWINRTTGVLGGGTNLNLNMFFPYSTSNPVYHYFLDTRYNTYIVADTYVLNDFPMTKHGSNVSLRKCDVYMPQHGINAAAVYKRYYASTMTCTGTINFKCENKKFRFLGNSCACTYTQTE